MENKYRIIALAVSMIFTSCARVDKNIEFLNSKDVLLITFGKEYSDLKQLNNYYNYTTESEISSLKVNNAYRCVAINGRDVDVSNMTTSLFNVIDDITSEMGSCLILTGFEDYDFLNDTPFVSPRKANVDIDKYYVYWSEGNGFGYRLTQVKAMDGTSVMGFDSYIITELYRKIYEFEKIQ